MISVEEVLRLVGGRIANSDVHVEGPLKVQVSRMSPLRDSTAQNLCFFFSKEYQGEIPFARPGILITGEPFVGPLSASGLPVWKQSVVIACADPYWAMAKLSGKFADLNRQPEDVGPAIHPSAVVHPTAKIGAGAKIGPHCSVDREAVVGEKTTLMAGVSVGASSKLGRDGLIFPNVTIYEGCTIGDRVRIHSSSVIGADGFGYAPEKRDGQIVRHEKIFHLGGVRIGHDVEIGASSAVDRGTLEDTVIEDMVKIDNFVQVGHNSWIKQGAILCGCSGVAGGTVVGRFAYLGGRATVVNKAEIGDGAQVGAGSLVTKDVPAGAQVAGSPHRPLREHLKIQARLNRMLEEKK